MKFHPGMGSLRHGVQHYFEACSLTCRDDFLLAFGFVLENLRTHFRTTDDGFGQKLGSHLISARTTIRPSSFGRPTEAVAYLD